MLRIIAEWLGDDECYCVPYAHLVRFYGRIGFAELAQGAGPSFLVARAEDYRSRGLKVTIMARAWLLTRFEKQCERRFLQ